jgi:hypothetical protein
LDIASAEVQNLVMCSNRRNNLRLDHLRLLTDLQVVYWAATRSCYISESDAR